MAFFQGQHGHVAPVHPHDVEHVIVALTIPRHFTIEDCIVHREATDGRGDRRHVLRKPVAREELDVDAAFVRDQPDAIELALEEPVVARKTLLRERRRHGLEPVGHRLDGSHGLLSPGSSIMQMGRTGSVASRCRDGLHPPTHQAVSAHPRPACHLPTSL